MAGAVDASVEDLIRAAFKMTEKEYEKNTKIGLEKLKETAEILINAYNKFLSEERLKDDVLKKFQNTITENDADKVLKSYIGNKKMAEDTIRYRIVYAAAFNFEKALDNYLGRLPRKAIFVVDNKQAVELPLDELIKMTSLKKVKVKDGGEKNVGLRIRKNKTVKDKTNLINNTSQTYKELSPIYDEIIKRLDRFYDYAGLSGTDRQGGFLVWEQNGNWTQGTVLNKGDLKEAYMAAIMGRSILKKFKKLQNGDIENKINIFYENYIAKVDNLSPIYHEDIVSKKIQYSVKSEGANMPELGPYLDIAKRIINGTFDKAIQKDLQNKEKEAALRNKIASNINEIIDDTKRKAVESVKAQLGYELYSYY